MGLGRALSFRTGIVSPKALGVRSKEKRRVVVWREADGEGLSGLPCLGPQPTPFLPQTRSALPKSLLKSGGSFVWWAAGRVFKSPQR